MQAADQIRVLAGRTESLDTVTERHRIFRYSLSIATALFHFRHIKNVCLLETNFE